MVRCCREKWMWFLIIYVLRNVILICSMDRKVKRPLFVFAFNSFAFFLTIITLIFSKTANNTLFTFDKWENVLMERFVFLDNTSKCSFTLHKYFILMYRFECWNITCYNKKTRDTSLSLYSVIRYILYCLLKWILNQHNSKEY